MYLGYIEYFAKVIFTVFKESFRTKYFFFRKERKNSIFLRFNKATKKKNPKF